MLSVRSCMKTVMVFGVFDNLHPGHRVFLRQAKRHGNALIVVVARDRAVQMLKGRKPHHSERQRTARIRALPDVARVVLGDAEQGSYRVLKRYRPDVICFGYDQKTLRGDIQRRMRKGEMPRMKLVTMKPYKPTVFHTSLIARAKP